MEIFLRIGSLDSRLLNPLSAKLISQLGQIDLNPAVSGFIAGDLGMCMGFAISFHLQTDLGYGRY